MTPRVAVVGVVLVLAGCGGTSLPEPAQPVTQPPVAQPVLPPAQPPHRTPACQVILDGAQTRPDPHCTPGEADPTVTIGQLCPTVSSAVKRSVTDAEKRQVRQAYGEQRPGEIDHLIPVSLAGADTVRNLWPEVGKIPNRKDVVENRLKREVCAGRISLPDAQQAMTGNWVATYRRLIGPLP